MIFIKKTVQEQLQGPLLMKNKNLIIEFYKFSMKKMRIKLHVVFTFNQIEYIWSISILFSQDNQKKKKKKPQSWFNIYIYNSCWNRQMFLFLQNLIFIIGNRSLCLNFSILLWYALSILPNKGKGEDTMSVLEALLVWLGEGKRYCGVLYPFLGCLGNSEWTEASIMTAFICVSS